MAARIEEARIVMTDSQGKFEEAKGYREPKEIGNKKPEGMRKPQVAGSFHYLDSTQDVSFIHLPLLLFILSCFFCSIHADASNSRHLEGKRPKLCSRSGPLDVA